MHTFFVICSVPLWIIGVPFAFCAMTGRVRTNGGNFATSESIAVAFIVGLGFCLSALALDCLDPLEAIVAVAINVVIHKRLLRTLAATRTEPMGEISIKII